VLASLGARRQKGAAVPNAGVVGVG
jgi:hypothetical protein